MAAYDLYFEPGVAGARANEEQGTIISRNVEDAAGIAFGLAVMQGSTDNGCVVSDGSTVLGIALLDRSAPEIDSTPVDGGYGQYQSARIMVEGVVWVVASGAVSAGEDVHALAGGALGSTGGTALTNARWDSSAADGELAKVRLQTVTAAPASV